LVLRMAAVRILMDGAYAHLAACYKRTTDHCIAELNGCLTPGAWIKSSCRAGCFFQESLSNGRFQPLSRYGLLPAPSMGAHPLEALSPQLRVVRRLYEPWLKPLVHRSGSSDNFGSRGGLPDNRTHVMVVIEVALRLPLPPPTHFYQEPRRASWPLTPVKELYTPYMA